MTKTEYDKIQEIIRGDPWRFRESIKKLLQEVLEKGEVTKVEDVSAQSVPDTSERDTSEPSIPNGNDVDVQRLRPIRESYDYGEYTGQPNFEPDESKPTG